MLSMRVCFYQCIAYRQIRYTITEDIMTKKTVRNTKKTIVCFYQCIAYRQIRYTITEDIMTKKTVRNTKKTIVSINERDYISLTDMVIKY